MVPLRDLFETHLTVADLQRSMTFFSEVLGLELAQVFSDRKVAFYWIGGRGNSMLGLWEVGTGPQKLNLHLAFKSDLQDLLDAPARLRAVGVVPLDFSGKSTDEPVVLAWMPAASLYFRDPDGHPLEVLWFPPDKGRAKWHAASDKLFLGIDHTAIVISNTDASLKFYRGLGMQVAGESENYGPEQERLLHPVLRRHALSKRGQL